METDIDAISVAIPMFFGESLSLVYMPTSNDATYIQNFQDGGRIPEVVITLRQKTTSSWSQRLQQCFRARPIHFHRFRQYPTSKNSIRYKREVETVPKTGSTNNLTTETDIDAISVAISIFWGKFITGVYANLTRRFLHPEIPRWRTDTGSSYNFPQRTTSRCSRRLQ